MSASKHSAIVGGSNCERLMQCPGSRAAIMSLPPSAEVVSSYAEEGVFAHKVMDVLMRDRMGSVGHPDQAYYEMVLRGYLGATFHDRELTQEHIETMIVPALEALSELETVYGDDFDVLGVETSVRFPGIPGAFGTTDLILGNATHVLHVDYKFGQGVPVKAVYTDELGERLNSQMMFYTAASVHSARHLYRNKKRLVIAIVQPRSDQPLTHTEVSRKDLRWFVEDLQNAVVAAFDRDPLLRKGDWCRFCPAKISCPEWVGPLLDLSSLGEVVQARTDTVSKQPTAYGEYLARAKALVDQMDLFKKTLDEQLHAYLEDGGLVPGWRLKQKIKQRQWTDEATVNEQLMRLGFAQDEIWQRKLQTFAATDATARRKQVKIPDELRVRPATNETTVCATDDPAPVVERQLAIEQFKASLQQLLKTASSPADDKATARQEAGK